MTTNEAKACQSLLDRWAREEGRQEQPEPVECELEEARSIQCVEVKGE